MSVEAILQNLSLDEDDVEPVIYKYIDVFKVIS